MKFIIVLVINILIHINKSECGNEKTNEIEKYDRIKFSNDASEILNAADKENHTKSIKKLELNSEVKTTQNSIENISTTTLKNIFESTVPYIENSINFEDFKETVTPPGSLTETPTIEKPSNENSTAKSSTAENLTTENFTEDPTTEISSSSVPTTSIRVTTTLTTSAPTTQSLTKSFEPPTTSTIFDSSTTTSATFSQTSTKNSNPLTTTSNLPSTSTDYSTPISNITTTLADTTLVDTTTISTTELSTTTTEIETTTENPGMFNKV